MDSEAMINLIKNGDQPLPRVNKVSIAGTSSTEQPPLKDKSMCNKTAKELWDAFARHMLGSEYGEQDRKAAVLYEVEQYATIMRHNKNLMDINIDALYNILKQNQEDVNDAMRLKKKSVVVTSDPLALIAEKTKSANKKQEFVKTDDKKVEKKDDEKKREMSKVKCYNCKKEGNFAKDCKKVKVNDYEYYKTKMLLAKKDNDEQVFLAVDQAWMESNSDSDQEKNAKMVFMAQIKKVLSDSKTSSSFADDKISEVLYYLSESESKSEYDTLDYYNNTTTYGLFVYDNDDHEIFHDCENFLENLIEYQINHNKSAVDHNDSEGVDKYAKLEVERYEYMIRYSAYFDNDKQHRKQIADQEVLYDKISVQLVELDKHVRDLKNTVLEKDFKISELEEYVRNKDVEMKKCLERLNVCENKLHKIGQTNQTVHMIMPSKDTLYNGQKGIGFENPSYFEKEKDLRPSLYDEKVIGLGYTLMFLTHSDEALEIEKFKRARENKIEFAYDYESLNASYVNEKIILSDDYFQKIINPDFEKIDSLFQQTSSLKPYVPTVILEKIIIDLEDEVVNLLEKEKANLETIESLKSKVFESSEYIFQICLWIIDSGCSKHMMGNRALLTNFMEKFLGTVHFGNNDFTMIVGYGDVVIGSLSIKKVYYVEGLPKMKFDKDHLCSACEQGKIHRKHHKSKTVFASNKPLYLLHMDLCGPMRVESINKKRYVLVVVDDYSRYTWHVQTDNGMVFKNKTLVKFFDEVGISQQFSAARTPQQNGVVERRNRTLVEAARTMLTFANLPLFLWAESIATTCFTQNLLIIHKRFDKTPYELMNKRKSNIKFFRVFGCRCYLLNDYEDVGKLKAKGDMGLFVGYLKESVAFIIYNKQTRKIHESVNDEYFDASNIMKSSTTNVENYNVEIPSHEEEVFHESSESFQRESSSSSLNNDVQQSPKEVILPQINTQSISNNMIPNVDEASTSHNVFNERLEDAYFDATNVAEALRDADWVSAMQEELDQFARLKYILDILKRFAMENYDTVPTPMVKQAKLKLDLVGKPVDHTDYQSMIGSLMYVTSSIPYIMFATCMCARYQANPNENHVSAVKRIFRYLKGTINLGLLYPKDSGFDITAYSDADHAGCHLDQKRIILAYVDGVTRNSAKILILHYMRVSRILNSSVPAHRQAGTVLDNHNHNENHSHITRTSERIPRKGQNRIKTGQKREAWRSQEKSEAVTQTSSLKPYVPNVILEKIIIDLEDEVRNLLEKEKVNLETIESLKSKSFESSEKVIAPGMFKLNVSQCVSPISLSNSSCDYKNVEIKLKRKRHLDTFSSVRRPRHGDVIWKKKGSSNTSNVGLSDVIVSNLNKNVKRYSRKDLLACNNSHLGETSSAY
nr:hypothetical protein [Tanacetum cinerariifolium]